MKKEFRDRKQWRSWLDKHHDNESEVWLVLYKKNHRRRTFGLEEAVEEALCYGWIDSVLKPIDSMKYMLRYSPRKKNSTWSKSNIDRVNKLIANGKMRSSGLAKVQEARLNGQWEAAIKRERTEDIPGDLKSALRRRRGAIAAYRALKPSRKKEFLYWLETAKQDITRKSRIQKIVDEMCRYSAPD
ncbi:MAG: YdeI/OmpD-associated family protein [Planctomycetota bacterium]|jgi:uncharacterized protein YdeI (YjbR/CyaY-like superfamily)